MKCSEFQISGKSTSNFKENIKDVWGKIPNFAKILVSTILEKNPDFKVIKVDSRERNEDFETNT